VAVAVGIGVGAGVEEGGEGFECGAGEGEGGGREGFVGAGLGLLRLLGGVDVVEELPEGVVVGHCDGVCRDGNV